MWLKPAMSNLRHLTIYSSLYFGYYPKLSFTGLYFPQLRTLSFGNLCFIDDSQLDWILSHGSTLTELYLDDCAILYEVTISNNQGTYLDADMYETRAEIYRRFHASYERRWCDYFQAFLGGLPHLQHFRYGSSPCWWVDDSIPFECETEIQIGLHAGSYLVFCEALAPRPYVNRSLSMDMTPKHPVQPLHPTAEDKEALKRLLAKTRQAVELNADDRS